MKFDGLGIQIGGAGDRGGQLILKYDFCSGIGQGDQLPECLQGDVLARRHDDDPIRATGHLDFSGRDGCLEQLRVGDVVKSVAKIP